MAFKIILIGTYASEITDWMGKIISKPDFKRDIKAEKCSPDCY